MPLEHESTQIVYYMYPPCHPPAHDSSSGCWLYLHCVGPDHSQSLFYFTPQTIARIFTVCDQSLTIAHLQFSPNAYGGNFPDFSHLLKAKFRKGSFPFRTFWFFFNLVVVRLDPFSFQTQELFAMVTSFISVAATVLLVFPLNSSAHRWTQVNGMRWDLRVRQSDKNMF